MPAPPCAWGGPWLDWRLRRGRRFGSVALALAKLLRLYNILLLPLRALCALRSACAVTAPSRKEWEERRARRLPRAPEGGIWIHGASVGETRIVEALASALRRARSGQPIAVSCTTRSGRARLPSPPAVDAAFYAPLDFPGLPSRVLGALRPALLVLVETELWPNLLREAARAGIPVALANGRLSPDRASRYRRLRRLYAPLVGGLAWIGAQTEEEAARFFDLGATPSRVAVTGNVKYDLPVPTSSPEALGARFGVAPDRPVVVAGSTARGEDRAVLEAFAAARRRFPDAFLILAPRHPERASEAESQATALGLTLHRASSGRDRDAGRADGLLLDTLGELAPWYGLARAAFVGGSLVPVGGHNVLEPAAAGAPVLFGPHTQNFRAPCEDLLAAGGAARVASAGDLAAAWESLLADPARRSRMARAAADLVRRNRGALDRTVSGLLAAIDVPSLASPRGSRP